MFICVGYGLWYDGITEVGRSQQTVRGLAIVIVILLGSLIPAALLLLGLFLRTRSGKRVLRPKAQLGAFVIGALTIFLTAFAFASFGSSAPGGIGAFEVFYPAAICAAPSTAFAVLLTRRPVQTGLCLKCGYDLRASQERCPECGTVIPADLVREAMR